MDYVIYHAHCNDGFLAAFTCWLIDKTVITIPRSYQSTTPLSIPDNQDIFIVDFSLPRDELIALAARSKKVTVIDHHKTAEEALSPLIGQIKNLDIIFDQTKCGSMLIKDYFVNYLPRLTDRQIEIFSNKIYCYVQDRDLWQWKMRASKEINAALWMEPKEFQHWEDIVFRYSYQELLVKGSIILSVNQSFIDLAVKHAHEITLGDYTIMASNTPFLQSEVCDAIINRYPQYPFAAAYYCRDVISWSLRSKGDFDVSIIAKNFGGGGHKNAAGMIYGKAFNSPT